ncbi:hypothetical protein KHM83_08710 [Fusibacter paucivorans]|uniref:Uncharacterized protein n=1 Tax=Fusibacter paucivorans TaxID=76009 RepID=A0ABS5PQ88_9FIRM|nr:hypothetical protein [Fusibacter paucivorans]
MFIIDEVLEKICRCAQRIKKSSDRRGTEDTFKMVTNEKTGYCLHKMRQSPVQIHIFLKSSCTSYAQ